ncbi:MAG TPA: phosphate signaling complex protein PhoU [Gammaproteobacteria bacterium]|nr:phosphate signaling complex protein PhoU [Gammaproteobacteria bacterium]
MEIQSKHISQQFNEEMENLRNQVMKMGGLVEQQISNAVLALKELDVPKAEKVIKKDHMVNALEVSVDEECARILARRQPAASDLRMVVAVIKTITDLERIGDEAEKVAKMAIHIAEDDGVFHARYNGIRHLSDHVSKMLHDALDAFARLDTETALRVLHDDEEADSEYQSLMRQLITHMMEDPRTISEVLDIMWAARALERIGDHSKNIGEYVIYLVEGRDIRHLDTDELEEIEKDLMS